MVAVVCIHQGEHRQTASAVICAVLPVCPLPPLLSLRLHLRYTRLATPALRRLLDNCPALTSIKMRGPILLNPNPMPLTQPGRQVHIDWAERYEWC